MSIVPAEPEATDVHPDVAPEPRPSIEYPYEARLSAELVEVIARWMREPRWKRWIDPAPLPGYRRHLD
jgi:hypothetical protein